MGSCVKTHERSVLFFSFGAPLRILCHQTRPIEALLRDEHMLATSLNMYFTISEGGLQHHQEPEFV
jgi:hypothetical protein